MTVAPTALTSALIVSPGATASATGIAGAGTSSYQA